MILIEFLFECGDSIVYRTIRRRKSKTTTTTIVENQKLTLWPALHRTIRIIEAKLLNALTETC